MDAKDKKLQSSENQTAKEVKGVIEDSPNTNNTSQRESMEGKNDNKTVKGKQQEPKGLPHQQVAQPGDFSSEALEHI
ncbi:hypothetical protein L484_000314 [Morus notabilis]|uniref:Uncharacterized protein n=1 Tax=Morus notabilis TaxID=981085 RepID=W9SEU7_9ROSA|nr:hypothetical protein L484_020566 [Morus notabilis]EXC54276.1 hypothetical protein L484_000314 [Morus notabilis]